MFDLSAELRQVIEGHSWVHVVLEMILHVPVIEGGYPRTSECTRILPKVWPIRIQAIVLCDTTEKAQPTAVLGADREQHDEKPMTCSDKDNSQAGMPNQEEARPVTMTSA